MTNFKFKFKIVFFIGDIGSTGPKGEEGSCPDLLPLIKGGSLSKGIKGDQGETGQKGLAG